MRIAVLTQVAVYPADAGAKIKTLQVLRHLARRHDIFYCTFTRSAAEREQLQKMPVPCRRIITIPLGRSLYKDSYFFVKSLLANDSFLLLRDSEQSMKNVVERLVYEEKIDILHIDQLNMMRFAPLSWPGKIVLDEHNAVWLVVERLRQAAHNPLLSWFLRREVRQLRRIEGEACRRATTVLAVSEQDRRALQEIAGPTAHIVVVPICVDSAQFAELSRARAPVPGRLLTIGTLFWPPNSEGILWWLRAGYPHLQKQYPGATYDIVGARPPRALRELIKKYATVHLHGYVADASPFWSQATALVVPLRSGAGVRVKILEAMAIGIPVISTSIGCEGLAVENGRHLLIADTATDFARACAAVLQDRQLAHTLAINAALLINERYNIQTTLETLATIY